MTQDVHPQSAFVAGDDVRISREMLAQLDQAPTSREHCNICSPPVWGSSLTPTICSSSGFWLPSWSPNGTSPATRSHGCPLRHLILPTAWNS